MRNNVHTSPDDIDPVEIFAAIKRNLVKLLVASLLVGLITFVVLALMKPTYKSVAQLQFGGRAVINPVGSNRPQSGRERNVLVRVDKAAVASQVAVIKSRDLALKLIEELKLVDNPEFNPTLSGGGIFGSLGLGGSSSRASITDRVLLNYDKALKVFHGKDTRVVSIQFSSNDAKLSAAAANKLAQLYLSSRAKQSVKRSVDAGIYLKAEIIKLQKDVQTVEAAVEEYRGSHNLFAVGAGAQRGTLNNAQLADLTRELTRAQTQNSEAEARAKGIRELMRRGSADASPDVLRSPLIQQLQGQRVRVERQVSELSATLLPAHPRMRQMRADLNGLNRQIRGEVRKIADSLAKEANVAGLRVQSIRASIDSLKSQVRNSSGDVAKLAELERGAKAKRQQLESLQARYQTALARQQTSAIPLEAELFSKARASTIPALKKGPITALAMAGTFLLGLAFVITKELLAGSRSGGGAPGRGRRSTDRHAPMIEEPMRASAAEVIAVQPVSAQAGTASALAATPMVVQEAAPAETAAPTEAAAPAAAAGEDGQASADSIRKLPQVDSIERFASYSSLPSVARHIAAQHNGGSGRRTLVATDTAGEYAGDETIEIATHLALNKARVIVVDWSPASDGLATSLDLPPRPGMTDLLTGDATFEDIIRCLSGSDVHFIAGGTNLDSCQITYDADRLNLVLDALDEAYDHIVVHGDHKDARALFEAIQGRFDTGLTVVSQKQRISVLADQPDTFLGFEVSDLDIIRFERDAAAPFASRQDASGELLADAQG